MIRIWIIVHVQVGDAFVIVADVIHTDDIIVHIAVNNAAMTLNCDETCNEQLIGECH